jgi:hypothetical protein
MSWSSNIYTDIYLNKTEEKRHQYYRHNFEIWTKTSLLMIWNDRTPLTSKYTYTIYCRSHSCDDKKRWFDSNTINDKNDGKNVNNNKSTCINTKIKIYCAMVRSPSRNTSCVNYFFVRTDLQTLHFHDVR